jgi:Flp pilus assembly protein TadG
MNFVADQRGNTATLFALLSALLFGAAGVAIDFAHWNSQRAELQQAADAAAIAGAVELGLGGLGVVNRATQRADALVSANSASGIAGAAKNIAVDKAAETVTVDLAIDGKRTLSRFLVPDDKTLAARATAKVAGRTVACIYALNATESSSFHGNGSAMVQATNCAIYVNSNASDALANSGVISADHICVVGGHTGGGYTPEPQDNCPAIADPFLNNSIPAHGACSHNGLNLNSDTTLDPGVYCGGLQVSGDARITMNPGVYFVVDGDIKVSSGGSLEGAEVAIVLYGAASVDISGSGAVVTTPPVSGEAAGFSIMQDRNAPLGGVSKITGDGRFEFPGIIYMPRQTLEIAGRAAGNINTPTYAAIVADKIVVSGSGDLNATADTSLFGKDSAKQITVVNARLIE